jgi:hypothetical protein
MCSLCNNLKGNSVLSLNGVKKLRKIYDKNIDKLTKKELNSLIEDKKNKFILDKPVIWNKNQEENILIAKCDIKICRNNSNLVARSFYSNKNKEDFNVACIKKGTKIVPSIIDDNVIYVNFNNDRYQINKKLLEFANYT